MKGRIDIDRELCKGCGLCITVCPKDQIQISDQLNKKGYYPAHYKEEDVTDVNELQCIGCCMCAITCPDVAIEVYKEDKQKKGDTESDQPSEEETK